MTKRQERLKSLMRDRNTIEQGLTLYQVFCEVYPDIVEEYRYGKRDEYGVETIEYVFREKYNLYTSRLIKHLRKADDAFRWLFAVPHKDERRKIKEYVYVNIKPGEPGSYGFQLLEEVNALWTKHAKETIKGMERTHRRLEQLAHVSLQENDEALNQVLEENKMIQDGVIDDPEEYFEGKKTRLSIQKRKYRLATKRLPSKPLLAR